MAAPRKRKRSVSSTEPASSSFFTTLEPSTPAAEFAAATPYQHVQLPSIVKQPLLLRVREELGLLASTFKETDLFKVYQTGDLANLDPENAEHAAALPATIALRSALYSERFRSFVRKVTGCAPLTGQQDCSCNVYRRGGHLLCHDDVIGTRCVSYILYLSRPGKRWHSQLGGALELYELSEGRSGDVLPAPVRSLAPEFGTMVLFTVQPGISYHSVQEVGSKEPRLAISGWFHAKLPPTGADSTASLAQLRGQLQSNAGELPKPRPIRRLPQPQRGLTPKDVERMKHIINPAYLQPQTVSAVRAQLAQNGAALLASFLKPTLARAIAEKARKCDAKDGLDARRIPPHEAGTQRKCWRLIGPPQLRRYLRFKGGRLKPYSADEVLLSRLDGERSSLGSTLDEIRVVFHSAPFIQLMSALSGLAPTACASEVRRFRPGLDYTLAHVGTQRVGPTLDATLAFVPSAPADLALWDSGDVGGFECHVESSVEDEHGAAEVYRSSDDSAGVMSIHAANNALSLVMRKPDAMKFVKYVSAAAPGSRWDVAAEYSCAPPVQ